MDGDEKLPSKKSRVITGFHRLGLFFAVPLLLGALGVAVSAWFSDDGPYVPDPTAPAPPLKVVTRPHVSNLQTMTNDELWLGYAISNGGVQSNAFKKINLNTGPQRTFVFYQMPSEYRQGRPAPNENDEAVVALIGNSFILFDKSRGAVLLAKEQPILVGDVLVEEIEGDRKFSFRPWKHLTRGFDWERLAVAAGLAAFAVFAYHFARDGLGHRRLCLAQVAGGL